ncbi:dihydrodipicolinate synthase family protein [Arachidicoccus terrestris]|uniref:dihydrodipicolinate synthase family protein n=1 Tax=Arachidicoccus terrestris TaxID=2875539 RepID=UPI001CC787E4|nr:dihydrodipicolinate synthase family protein [Arachidicoccus terrestris]UAY56095.1 dihydrodipicolinate synthase family protein [Arachidicoccus terrestris]
MKTDGLIAATFGFYTPEGDIDLEPIGAMVDRLAAQGVSGVFICGTNGEGPNLTIEERMAVAETYLKAAKGKMLVFVHVGHASIREARKLAAHAEKHGADAISSVSAFYYKPGQVDVLVDSMAAIAAAAPNTPFYYYHIPTLTGVGLDMVAFLEQAEQAIQNLAGIKYTASTLHEYQACLNYKNGQYNILFGYDELLLEALSVGAGAAIGSTYAFAAPIYVDLLHKFRRGDLEGARRRQLESVNMVRCLSGYHSIAAQRAIMHMLGIPLGPCRLPLRELTENEYQELKQKLENAGFFKALEDAGRTLELQGTTGGRS